MKKGLWKKTGAVLVSLTLLVGAAALPASAAALSENFEEFGSTDDLSMNWFGYGDFITDITLSKTGGVDGSKGLKIAVEYSDSAKDKWGTLRGTYADDMSSKVATGIRFWAKADQEGQEMQVIMVYNNMSWKYDATVKLSKTGKYYEVPFSSMKLNYGTVTVPNGTDPQYINEWQFQFPRNLEVGECSTRRHLLHRGRPVDGSDRSAHAASFEHPHHGEYAVGWRYHSPEFGPGHR